MPNQFYVEPAGNYSRELSGLSRVLQDVGEQRRMRKEQEEQQQMMQQAQEEAMAAFESGDMDQAIRVGIKYPWMKDIALKGMNAKGEAAKERTATRQKELFITPPEQRVSVLEKHIQEGTQQGFDMSDSVRELERYKRDTEFGNKLIDFNFATSQPDEAKAWKEMNETKEQWEPIYNDAGDIVGQRNTVTSEVKKDPRAATGKQDEIKPFTLSEGQARYDANGNLVAERPKNSTEKAPDGYRYKEDNTLEVIPGGPADHKLSMEDRKSKLNEEKMKARGESKQIKAAIVEGKVDEAMGLVDDWFTTGFPGQILSIIGGTDARNLQGTLDTIRANLGFAELQSMRDSTPTGASGLGQLAVKELEALQSVVASLDQAQDDATLKQNLAQIRTHMKNWKSYVDSAIQAGDTYSSDSPPEGFELD